MIHKILIAKGKKFYVRNLEENFHCQYGFITKEDLQQPAGTTVTSNTGVAFTVQDPTFFDLYEKLKRAPQIVPRKDIALFITECGITKDAIVVDAGTGSGAVACLLAKLAKKVYTLEVREDHHKVAKKNIEDLNIKNIVAKVGSIYDTVPVKNADAFFLDVPEPWNAVQTALASLKVGGFLCSYSPCIPQVSDFCEEVRKHEQFLLIKTIEVTEKTWEVNKRKIRPKSAAIGHSGFLTIVRKVSN